MKRKTAFDRLKWIVPEYEAVRDASRFARSNRDPKNDGLRQIFLSKIGDRANVTLNGTYLLRGFATFESVLSDYWKYGCGKSTQLQMKQLLNTISARLNITQSALDRIHEVRDVRNHIIHEDRDWEAITLQESMSRMCKYVSFLPLKWPDPI